MKRVEAGTLTENDNGSYSFEYESGYFTNPSMAEVSLTLPFNPCRRV
ncbi:MAG: HipA N-terminal domain-containing protein [Bacteroidales bacterium]